MSLSTTPWAPLVMMATMTVDAAGAHRGCCPRAYAVRPRQGGTQLWVSALKNGTLPCHHEVASLQAGCKRGVLGDTQHSTAQHAHDAVMVGWAVGLCCQVCGMFWLTVLLLGSWS